MTLPALADFVSYFRVENTVENALITQLLAEAVGSIETRIGKSLTTETVLWYDDAVSFRAWEAVRNLYLQYVPIQASTVVVTDLTGGTVVDPTQYMIRQDLGLILGIGMFRFQGVGPYSIACTAGYGTDPNYTNRWLPMIFQLVLDYAGWLYLQRNPGARTEKSAGTFVDYSDIDRATQLPTRIAGTIRKLRGPVFAR